MRKLSKSIAALSVVVMIIMSLLAPAMATNTTAADGAGKTFLENETETADVTVTTGNEGDTLYMFKVVEITYDVESNTLKHEFTSLFNGFQDAEEIKDSEFVPYTIETYAALIENEEGNAEKLSALLGKFSAYVKGLENFPEGKAGAEETDAAGDATFTGVDMGQYIIVGGGTSSGARIYQTVTATIQPEMTEKDDQGYRKYYIYSAYEVEMKTDDTGIEKAIVDGADGDADAGARYDDGKATATVGEKITYEIEIKVPTYPVGATNTSFFFGDTLSTGLKFVGPVKVTGFIQGQEPGTDSGTTLSEDYPVDTDELNTDGSGTFYVDFTYENIKTFDKLIVTYNVEITEDIASGTDNANKNTVVLIFSNDPFNGKNWDEEGEDRPGPDKPGYGKDESGIDVYTYKIQVDKYDADDSEVKLAGAVFEVYYVNGNVLVDTITTNAEGFAETKGLKAGEYYLKEITAPTGYNLPLEGVVFNITAEIDSEEDNLGGGIFEKAIPNSTGLTIPGTGGIGTTIFYVVGGLLMAGAVIFLITKKRMQASVEK